MKSLSLSDVAKRFGPTVALDGVSLELRPGEVHALIGENGAGKTTLMNILAGALRPDRGKMQIDGQPYAPPKPFDACLHGIALIHQELSLCPHLSVAENIMMGMESARLGWLNRMKLNARTQQVLSTFSHPQIHPDTRVADLSVANRQIVEICRAVAARARILLMDEPTSSLQRADVELLFRLIRKLRSEGFSIIYISHFLEEVREIADRFTMLRDGRSVATGDIASVSDEDLITQMVGRPVQNLFPVRAGRINEADTVLEVSKLSSPPGLKQASFALRRGEILGVAGLMGSGRSQLIRAIFGLGEATSGTITLNRKTFSARAGEPANRLFQGLGYLSEDRKGEGLGITLSIADNVTMTRFASCSRWGWLDRSRQQQQTMALVNSLGIRAGSVTRPVKTLSGGNQQKVTLARLLHQEADVLLLDEPTRGIDIGSKVQVYKTIADCADSGKAVLMVSSYLPELFGMSNRLAVMSRGQLSEARPTEEWTPESVIQSAVGSTPQ
jgi:ribose transport system ATP-binding protein